MEIIDIINALRDVLKKIFGVHIPDAIVAYMIFGICVISLLYWLIKLIILVCGWIEKLRQKPWRDETIKKILTPDYCDQLAEQKYFISTKFTTTPPNNLEDPMEVERTESAKNLIDYFIDSVLVEANTTNRFYCILAGAGMGKTTWTVNLVTSYIRRYKKSTCPFDIKLISLAHKDFADMVLRIENKNHTILILDALDENSEASADIVAFMQKLDNLIRNFRFVILTSRTQFFPSEDDEPHKTSILKLSGDKGNYVYHKMYISPFTQDDVAAFLCKKYNNRRKRKKAETIVKRCASLATRPLLLSHLDDILESDQEYMTLYDIYTALIDAWVKREVRFFSGEVSPELCERLYNFSIDFAVQLFANREQSTNMRMRREQYNQFITDYNYTNYNFSGRSLINRDAEGTLKFSHKTFYEYFLAKAKFINPDLDIPKSGYELAWIFYRDMVRDYFKGSSSKSLIMGDEDISILIKGRGYSYKDYKRLSEAYNIVRIGFPAKIISGNPDFTKWLAESGAVEVDIMGYDTESISFLLNMENLKIVYITRLPNASARIKKVKAKLEEKGVMFKVTNSQFYVTRFIPKYMVNREYESSENELLELEYKYFLELIR